MAQEIQSHAGRNARRALARLQAAHAGLEGPRRGDFCHAHSCWPHDSTMHEVRAFADRGLEGDRFFRESWNDVKRPDKAVSLIEDEVLELAARELGVDSIADQTRRNIVTRGVPLIELLGSGIHHRRGAHARHPPVRALRSLGKSHQAAGIFPGAAPS